MRSLMLNTAPRSANRSALSSSSSLSPGTGHVMPSKCRYAPGPNPSVNTGPAAAVVRLSSQRLSAMAVVSSDDGTDHEYHRYLKGEMSEAESKVWIDAVTNGYDWGVRNADDVLRAREAGISDALIDRLTLDEERFEEALSLSQSGSSAEGAGRSIAECRCIAQQAQLPGFHRQCLPSAPPRPVAVSVQHPDRKSVV